MGDSAVAQRLMTRRAQPASQIASDIVMSYQNVHTCLIRLRTSRILKTEHIVCSTVKNLALRHPISLRVSGLLPRSVPGNRSFPKQALALHVVMSRVMEILTKRPPTWNERIQSRCVSTQGPTCNAIKRGANRGPRTASHRMSFSFKSHGRQCLVTPKAYTHADTRQKPYGLNSVEPYGLNSVIMLFTYTTCSSATCTNFVCL